MVSLAAALALTIVFQSPTERDQAEDLARAGRTQEAIAIYRRILEQNPADTDARLWIARLNMRIGKTEDAEAAFRSVVREHPGDVDARIGLGAALTRRGAWDEAIAILHETEPAAGQNADLFGTLARAYRRAGDDRSALEYFERARALTPTDWDIVSGYEATAQVYGHSIVFDGFTESGSTGTDAQSGSLSMLVRAAPQLHIHARGRVQRRTESTDVLGGGGVLWRAGRATTVGLYIAGGSGNTSLPTTDMWGEVVHYTGAFEVGGSIRGLSFVGTEVIAASPTLSWDRGGRTRLDSRYTYSRTRFTGTGDSSGDHSVMVRDTLRLWRRVWLNATYAYGIESFEELSADRIGSLGATTVAVGVRFALPWLTVITPTWEHQWRSNDSAIDRLTLSVVQTFK
ncbi:MAG TPA: tetratricopeptide repeat protein [Vicinamibacterales bacterium]|nr:tetratricopeptide repeat protein [Vicinamibacterales bacterium]